MGVSTDGILIYGVDFGNPNEFYDWDDIPEWLKNENGDMYGDFVEKAEALLLAELVGFTETAWEAEGFWERKREAEKKMGLQFDYHCSDQYPMYILGISSTKHRAWRGSPEKINPSDLVVSPEDDEMLRKALQILGAKDKEPSWLLASWWG